MSRKPLRVCGFLIESFVRLSQRMKKWNNPQTDGYGLSYVWPTWLLSVSNFSLCPTCCNVVVIKELILICYGASCCFVVPHNQGLIRPPLTGTHSDFNVCFIYAKADWLKPDCPSGFLIGYREVVWKHISTNNWEGRESVFYCLILVDLARSSAINCTEIV